MRTTLDLPEQLLKKAMKISHSRSKTSAIKMALEQMIRRFQISDLKQYKGKIDLDIDLNVQRNR